MAEPAPPQPMPGTKAWLPDPTGRFDRRLWDGKMWTDNVVKGDDDVAKDPAPRTDHELFIEIRDYARRIYVLLVWMLVVIPVVAVIVALVISSAAEAASDF